MKVYFKLFGITSCLFQVFSIIMSCGIDNSPFKTVHEGQARIEIYPWLGVLYYPYVTKRFTTAVILINRQLVLAAAVEIDKFPKRDFRDRSRVVIGHNCKGPHIRVREYIFHADYSSTTYSTFAIIQLETDSVDIELRPICPPPSYFNKQIFYAMVPSNDCRLSRIMVYKMEYVSLQECKAYYKKIGLDIDSMWPVHTACAKSTTGGRCVWRSGTVLVTKVGKRWRLLGFGVYGPGCEEIARFIDYGMYYQWVKRTIDMIGTPSVTVLADNDIIVRQMASNVQRFGPCDEEETAREIYTDSIKIKTDNVISRTFFYNVSLYENAEYSCVVLTAKYRNGNIGTPHLRLVRWRTGYRDLCCASNLISTKFQVVITYIQETEFKLKVYGKNNAVITPKKAMLYLNGKESTLYIPSFDEVKADMKINDYFTDWFRYS